MPDLTPDAFMAAEQPNPATLTPDSFMASETTPAPAPPKPKLNAAGLPEASAAVQQATDKANQFVQSRVPAIDPLSGMAIPGVPGAAQMPLPSIDGVSNPNQPYYSDAGKGTLMQGHMPVPVTPQQQSDRTALLSGGQDLQRVIDQNPAVGYVMRNAAPDDKATAVSLGTGMGLGALGAAAGTATGAAGAALKGAHAAISGYFAYEGAKGASPELSAAYDEYKAGNYDKMVQHLGTGGVQALFAFMAGHDAVKQAGSLADDALASHNEEAQRLVKQDAGEPTPFLPPADGKLTPEALETMQRIEPDADKRAALAAEAKKRALPVPDRGAPSVNDFMTAEEAKASQSPDAFMQAEQAPPDSPATSAKAAPTAEEQYRALFDEADKRMDTAQKRAAQTAPEVPEQGESDQVQRVVDARSRLAQSLTGKPWADVSNSEANTIDALVKQGFGTAVQPGEKAAEPGESERPPSENRLVGNVQNTATTPAPTKVVYGKPTTIRVAGENTSYPARYAIRESDDVQTSHDPVTFQPNPDYPHQNDRDYTNPENAARTVEYSMPGKFNPDFTLTDSPTAEHGSTITDQAGNALSGNNRGNVLARVYDHPELGPMYRAALADKASQFGIDPKDLAGFDKPTLTRELTDPKVDPQKAITDFNKSAPAALMPEERAVADGRRLSPETLKTVSGLIEDHGEGGSLADALRGDNGAAVVQHLVDDGVITDQEKNGMVDQSGNLTTEAKGRVAKALTGRLFASSGDYAAAGPELRGKLERVAPQVFRTEGRPEWALGDHVQDAVSLLNESKARGVSLDDLVKQPDLDGKMREASPEALAIAKKLQEGPNKAAAAFRQYANDEAHSRPGAQESFFEPPTRKQAFEAAFSRSERPFSPADPAMAAHDSNNEPYDPASTMQALFERSTFNRVVRPAGDPVAIHTNMNGLHFLARTMGAEGSFDSRGVGGFAVPARDADFLATRLENTAKRITASSPRAAATMYQLAKHLREDTGRKGVAFVRPVHDYAKTLNEELDHARLFGLKPENPLHGHVDAPSLFAGPHGATAREAVREAGYGKNRDRTLKWNEAEVAGEVGVRLMQPDRHAELGLSREEASELASHYIQELVKQHGSKADRIVAQIHEAYPDSKRGQTVDPSGRKGGPTESGQGSGSASERGPGSSGRGTQGDVPAGQSQETGGHGDRPNRPDRPAGSGQTGGTQSGGNPVKKLFAKLTQRTNAAGEPQPSANYSGLGATKSKFARNLSQLETASPRSHEAAVRAASSRAMASAVLRGAVPKITEALRSSGGTSWQEMRQAMIESRLRGARARWQEIAEGMSTSSDEDLEHAMTGGGMMDLLKVMQGKRQLPTSVSDTAATLLEQKDYGTLREFLGQQFGDAVNAVGTIMDPDRFDAVRADPGFRAALTTYKDLVEAPMARSHASNEGVFSDALGPLDTYYPLIPIDRAEGNAGAPKFRSYATPENSANNFATGFGSEFDDSADALAGTLTSALRTNDKAALIRTLQSEGWLQKVKPGVDQSVFDKGDRSFNASATPDGRFVAPDWLLKELKPILEPEPGKAPKDAAGMVARVRRAVMDPLNSINKIALSGPADVIFHSNNLVGAMAANTPWIGDLLEKGVSNLPFTKKIAAMLKIATTDPSTPEAVMHLQEMARLGVLPEKYGTETFSRQFAEDTGAQLHRSSMGPLLYGPKGIDVRARLAMYRIGKSINPGMTPLETYKFVNQMGIYNKALASGVERSLKSTGFSPFATAGSTMIRNGVNAWTGAGPMPKSGMGVRVAQMMTGGALGTIGMWIAAHQLYRGTMPWDEKDSKLLQIKLKPEDRYSKVGRALYGDGPEDGFVNLAFFNPLVSRGAKALGLSGAYDSVMRGDGAGKTVEAMTKDSANTLLHPVLGPAARASFVGVTGAEPYITALRDRNSLGPKFLPAVKNASTGMGSVGARAVAAMGEMNSFYKNVGTATGLLPQTEEDQGNKWLRMVTDLTLPNLFNKPSMSRAQSVASSGDSDVSDQELKRKAAENDIETRMRAGQPYEDQARNAIKDGVLAGQDVTRAMKAGKMTPLQASVERAPLRAALKAFQAASPEEQKTLRLVLARKAKSLQEMPAAEQAVLIPQFRKALGTE